MANQFTVTTSELNAKAGELQGSNRNLTTQINNLETQHGTLRGMWEGDAKEAFDKAFRHDIEQMKNFYTEINNYVAKLKEIAANYEKAEKKNLTTAVERKY